VASGWKIGQNAVIRQLEIIGSISKKASSNKKDCFQQFNDLKISYYDLPLSLFTVQKIVKKS